MPDFPRIEHKCLTCDGTGLEDVSHHGSPQYEKCSTCGGDTQRIFTREMTVNEKLDYLLSLVSY